MNNEVLESCFSRALDRDLSPEEFAEFEQHLIESREARAHYMEYVDLHNTLDLELQANTPVQMGTSKVIDINSIIHRQKRRSLKIATFSAAAILLIGLVTMRLFFVAEKEPALTFETSPSTRFTLTHSGINEAPEGLTLEQGSRLRLSQGAVKLTFASGVKSIVMAPVDLTLHDEDTLFINKGSAWFQVPEKAIGFQVITRDLDIIDLGTEFGILAKPDDHDEIHVIKGSVQATTQRLRKESSILTAGQARRIDPVGHLIAIPAQPGLFHSTLPKSLPHLYWSFDRADGFQIKGTHPAVADITTVPHPRSSPPPISQGKSGQCLSLDGDQQYLTTDWPGFAGNHPRTVSFWLKLHPGGDYRKPSGIVGWGNGQTDEYMAKWKIRCRQDARGADTYLDLSLGNFHIIGTTPLADGIWHHIVVTSSGKPSRDHGSIAEFYIDGQRETTHIRKGAGYPGPPIIDTETQTNQAYPLMIGRALNENVGHHGFFRGFVDELYIYDGHMSELDVQKLKR